MKSDQDDKESTVNEGPVPSVSRTRRTIEVAGFVAGLGILAWLVMIAIREGDWQRVVQADRSLLVGLLGCTVLSAFFNGAAFWTTIRPIKRVGFLELQGVNLVATMLNYAPVRLGMISRFAWHMRVDGLRFLDVVAWFASLLVLILTALGVLGVATLIAPGVGAGWWVLVAIGIIVAGSGLSLIARIGWIRRHGRGTDRILKSRLARWVGLLLRLLDVGTYAGRIAFSLAILGIEMTPSHIILLAVVALVTNLMPVGRFGFRELAVAWTAARLGSDSVVDVPWEQLALLESGAELLVYLPLGILCAPWFALGLRRGGLQRVEPDGDETSSSGPDIPSIDPDQDRD